MPPPLPFRGSVAIAAGRVTPNQLRGRRYLRVFPDIYVEAGPEPPDLTTRSLAAFLLVRERGGVLGGYSAAALAGVDCAPPGAPAEVVCRVDVRSHPGLLVRRGEVTAPDLWQTGEFLLTSPERSAWDLARRLDLVEAVVAVDALARPRWPGLPAFVPDDLLARRDARPGARGCRRLDRVVELADRRAESPMETRLRLLLVLGGLPAPVVQYELFDRGRCVARFDLAYPEAALAIEYDGRGHVDPHLSYDDRRRDVLTGDLGWHTMRLGHADVRRTGAATVALVRRQRDRRLGLRARST